MCWLWLYIITEYVHQSMYDWFRFPNQFASCSWWVEMWLLLCELRQWWECLQDSLLIVKSLRVPLGSLCSPGRGLCTAVTLANGPWWSHKACNCTDAVTQNRLVIYCLHYVSCIVSLFPKKAGHRKVFYTWGTGVSAAEMRCVHIWHVI